MGIARPAAMPLAIAGAWGSPARDCVCHGPCSRPAAMVRVNQVIRPGLEDSGAGSRRPPRMPPPCWPATELLRMRSYAAALGSRNRSQSAELQEQPPPGAGALDPLGAKKRCDGLIHRPAPGQADGESARRPARGFSGWSNSTAPARSAASPRLAPGAGETHSVLLSLGKARRCLAIKPRWGPNFHGALRRAGRLTVEAQAPFESLSGEKPAPLESARRRVADPDARQHRRSGRRCAPSATPFDVRGLAVHKAEAAVEETLRGARGPVW